MKKIILIPIFCIIVLFISISVKADIIYSFVDKTLETKLYNSNTNWVRLGDEFFIWKGKTAEPPSMFGTQKFQTQKLPYLIKHKNPIDFESTEVLFDKNGFAVVLLTQEEFLSWKEKENAFIRVDPMPENKVLYAPFVQKGKYKSETDTTTVETLIESLSLNDYDNYLSGLSKDFQTRYTLSDNFSDVTDWVEEQFSDLGYTPELHPFTYLTKTYSNVIAKKIGSVSPDDWYIVCGHYDSTSNNPTVLAPGADDNGSGAAGVLETARVLYDIESEASVLFIAFAGEEQGERGSVAYVNDLISSGELNKVKAVLNLDMIGYLNTGVWDVLIEGDPISEWLVNLLAAIVTNYEINLTTFITLDAWGSDHEPFLDNGIPAILLIEHEYSQNPNYHKTTDAYATVTQPYALEILKMNLAALASMNRFTLQTEPTNTPSPIVSPTPTVEETPTVTSTPVITPTIMPPDCDFNSDGIVDEEDLLILINNWHYSETSYISR